MSKLKNLTEKQDIFGAGFELSDASSNPTISRLRCTVDGAEELTIEADEVVFAVGAAALNALTRNSPELCKFAEFRRFSNLRGTSVLATRLFLDREVKTPYTANACWGFDQGVGMTFFNIGELHGDNFSDEAPGSVIEVDYYHANTLLGMSDQQIADKAKEDLNTMLGLDCATAKVVDAAIVRLPAGVNWYFPDSYKDMPDLKSKSLSNVHFAGDLVRTRHGSWSQEKAFVTGIEAANSIRGRPLNKGVIPIAEDEPHVAFGRTVVSNFRKLLGAGDAKRGPSLVDFIF